MLEYKPTALFFVKIVVASVCALIAFLSSSLLAASPTRPSDVELSDTDARDAAQDGHEVTMCMTRLGVDYPVLLQKARSGEASALCLIVWLGHYALLDGAAAEGYCYDLYRLAKKVGDQKFALAMGGNNRDVLNTCYRNLCFEVSQDDPGTRKAADALALTLPKTILAIQSSTILNPLWK